MIAPSGKGQSFHLLGAGRAIRVLRGPSPLGTMMDCVTGPGQGSVREKTAHRVEKCLFPVQSCNSWWEQPGDPCLQNKPGGIPSLWLLLLRRLQHSTITNMQPSLPIVTGIRICSGHSILIL